MTSRFTLTRRALIAAAGAALAVRPSPGAAQNGAPSLRAFPATLRLENGPEIAVAHLQAGDAAMLRLPQGRTAQIAFANDLPVAARLSWRGLAGPPPADDPVAPGGHATLTLPPQPAGTLLCVVEPVAGWPPAARAAVVEEATANGADRDEILLIEEWRVGADGRAVSPEHEPGSTAAAFTVNRDSSIAVTAAPNSRLRLRFINGSQRSVLAIRIPDYDIRFLAIASRPAEPFVARNGQLVLPPGGRVDAVVDMVRPPGSRTPILLHDGRTLYGLGHLSCAAGAPARPAPLAAPVPLPAEDLPATLDLARATRLSLDLAAITTPAAPAFRLKRGQVAVLALRNDATQPAVVWLSGHHVRLLDRLDDGWKPFWLDTLLVPPRTTERIAFLAAYEGRFPIEVTAPVWGAPRRSGWYAVE